MGRRGNYELHPRRLRTLVFCSPRRARAGGLRDDGALRRPGQAAAQRRTGGGLWASHHLRPARTLPTRRAIHPHVRRRTAAPDFHGKKKRIRRARMVRRRAQESAALLAAAIGSRLLPAGRGDSGCAENRRGAHAGDSDCHLSRPRAGRGRRRTHRPRPARSRKATRMRRADCLSRRRRNGGTLGL